MASRRDATVVAFVRIPDGMRGLIFRVFLPGGNPDGILFPAAAHSSATRPQGWAGCFILYKWETIWLAIELFMSPRRPALKFRVAPKIHRPGRENQLDELRCQRLMP
jgi:hypothetical protein